MSDISLFLLFGCKITHIYLTTQVFLGRFACSTSHTTISAYSSTAGRQHVGDIRNSSMTKNDFLQYNIDKQSAAAIS